LLDFCNLEAYLIILLKHLGSGLDSVYVLAGLERVLGYKLFMNVGLYDDRL